MNTFGTLTEIFVTTLSPVLKLVLSMWSGYKGSVLTFDLVLGQLRTDSQHCHQVYIFTILKSIINLRDQAKCVSPVVVMH